MRPQDLTIRCRHSFESLKMADRLNGYRILILETREEAQFSRLLKEQAQTCCNVPMFAIKDAPDPAPIEAWIKRAIATPFEICGADHRRRAEADHDRGAPART